MSGGQGQRDGGGDHLVEHNVGEGGLQTQGDPSTGELLANGVEFAADGDRAGGVDRAVDLYGAPELSWVQEGGAGGGPAGRARAR